MIYLIEGSEPLNLSGDGFIEAKSKENDISYGRSYSFLNFWQQKTNDQITALLCKFENTFFVSATENADFNELKDFLFAVGFESLQSYDWILQKLGFGKFQEYVCLKYIGEKEQTKKCSYREELKSAYDIICSAESKEIYKHSFASWYADISHRIRHKTAKVFVMDNTSAALVSHITESSAVISGVATVKDQRGKGHASKIVGCAVRSLSAENIFTAAQKYVAPFYIKNGFEIINKIGIYRS